MATPAPTNVDVLVIGAGPAGVMAANALARAGISVKIIDKRPVKVAAGQADGIQPRTLEIFQSYGILDTFLKEACQVHTAAFYNPGPGGIVRTQLLPDVTAPSARYPFEATLHQGAIEDIFLDSMRRSGVSVDRPLVPQSLQISTDEKTVKDPNAYAVQAVLSHPDDTSKTETVNAKFVIGCDGAHSWVRKSMRITLQGEQTQYIWGVVDIAHPDTNFPDIRNRCAIHSDNGSCMIIPREGDMVRLYIQLTDADMVDPETKRVDKNKMTPERLLDVARKSMAPYTFKTPDTFAWWTIYLIGQRVAEKFSINERVFIAGDACHTHSPKAGQGMNASMSDCHNIAWKLSHVLRGWADMSLLKTYEFERLQYARDLIAFDKDFSALFSEKVAADEATGKGTTEDKFISAFKMYGAFTSGIGIQYAPSMITSPKHQSHTPSLIIGQRMRPAMFIRAADTRPVELQDMLPADTRFKLLVFLPANANTEELGTKLASGLLADETKRKMLDVISIVGGKKEDVSYTDLPEVLRPHWSKVLLDDVDMRGTGGKGFESYGIPVEGALVLVRPDGYVAMVAPLDGVHELEAYFAEFIL